MKTINSININNAKNEVCNAFMQLMVPHIAANELIQREFAPQVEELQAQANSFATCLENHRFNLMTEKVTNADARRDKKWTAAKAMIVAEMESSDPMCREAAKTINKLFDSFGKIRDMGLAEQSGAMSSLCNDLIKNHTEELQLTSLFSLIEDLQRANNDFIAAYDERTESMSEYKKNLTRDVKLALITAYRTQIFLINAWIMQHGEEGLEDFIAYANMLIRQYRPMVGQKPSPGTDEELEEGLEEEEEDGAGEGDGSTEEGGEQKPGEGGGTTTPPAGGGESTGGGGGETPKKYTATFIDSDGQVVAVHEYEAGERITPPAGNYNWYDVPATMPAENITIVCPPSLE